MARKIKLGLCSAGHVVDTVMDWEAKKGWKFESHARETLLTSLEYGVEEQHFLRMVERYKIPRGIKMPWGVHVQP